MVEKLKAFAEAYNWSSETVVRAGNSVRSRARISCDLAYIRSQKEKNCQINKIFKSEKKTTCNAYITIIIINKYECNVCVYNNGTKVDGYGC